MAAASSPIPTDYPQAVTANAIRLLPESVSANSMGWSLVAYSDFLLLMSATTWVEDDACGHPMKRQIRESLERVKRPLPGPPFPP